MSKTHTISRRADISQAHPVAQSYQDNNFYYAHGRNHSFTSSFSTVMYQDNSLDAATRIKTRFFQSHKEKQLKRQRELRKLEDMQAKRNLVELYAEKYKITCDHDNIYKLSTKELLI